MVPEGSNCASKVGSNWTSRSGFLQLAPELQQSVYMLVSYAYGHTDIQVDFPATAAGTELPCSLSIDLEEALLGLELKSCRGMAEALLAGTSTGLANFAQTSRILHHEPGSGSVSLWAFGVLLVVKALGNETADMFSAFEMQVWPGLGPPPHFQSETDETWILLDGDMTWYVGDKVVDAKPGSHLFLPRLFTHSWRVNANKSARMLVIFSPGRFGDFFMEIGKEELGIKTLPAPEALVPPVPTEQEVAHGLHLARSKYGIEFDFYFKPQS